MYVRDGIDGRKLKCFLWVVIQIHLFLFKKRSENLAVREALVFLPNS